VQQPAVISIPGNGHHGAFAVVCGRGGEIAQHHPGVADLGDLGEHQQRVLAVEACAGDDAEDPEDEEWP
jgi:hypothetical protein